MGSVPEKNVSEIIAKHNAEVRKQQDGMMVHLSTQERHDAAIWYLEGHHIPYTPREIVGGLHIDLKCPKCDKVIYIISLTKSTVGRRLPADREAYLDHKELAHKWAGDVFAWLDSKGAAKLEIARLELEGEVLAVPLSLATSLRSFKNWLDEYLYALNDKIMLQVLNFNPGRALRYVFDGYLIMLTIETVGHSSILGKPKGFGRIDKSLQIRGLEDIEAHLDNLSEAAKKQFPIDKHPLSAPKTHNHGSNVGTRVGDDIKGDKIAGDKVSGDKYVFNFQDDVSSPKSKSLDAKKREDQDNP